MNLQSLLKDLGLFDSDIRIYLYLLEQGISTPPQIARGTKIARTNTYVILKRLTEKGLIEEQKRGKRKAYIATDPLALEQSFERKRDAIHQMLPDLRALYSAEKNKPKIQYYEGWEQVRQIYDLTYQAEKVFAFGSTEKLFLHDKKFYESHAKRVKERGIIYNDILTHESGDKSGQIIKDILKGFYDFKVLPKQYNDLSTDILIWDDHIAFIDLNNPVFGTVITNPSLAKTLYMMFDALWNKL